MQVHTTVFFLVKALTNTLFLLWFPQNLQEYLQGCLQLIGQSLPKATGRKGALKTEGTH